MQHTEIKLNSKEIFKGNVFRVTMDQVELENGMTSFREVVHHNGGACILPLTDDDKVLMVRLYPTVGYDSEKIYIWAAKGLKPTSQHLDDGEFLDVAALPFDDVLQMVMTAEIRDSKTVTALLKYAWLRQRGEG